MPDVFRTVLKTIHVFDNINPEASYWLGYLMADGCVTNERPRLMLECKTEDREILEHFCDFCGVRQNRITIGHQGRSAALSLAQSNFSTPVTNYGIIPHKSHIQTHIPQEVLSTKDNLFQYIKGIFDGDGTINTSSRAPGIQILSNSNAFIEELRDQLRQLLPTPSSLWIITRDEENIPKATQNLYELKIGTGVGRDNLIYLFKEFYSNYPIILKRKYETFKTLIPIGSL